MNVAVDGYSELLFTEKGPKNETPYFSMAYGFVRHQPYDIGFAQFGKCRHAQRMRRTIAGGGSWFGPVSSFGTESGLVFANNQRRYDDFDLYVCGRGRLRSPYVRKPSGDIFVHVGAYRKACKSKPVLRESAQGGR